MDHKSQPFTPTCDLRWRRAKTFEFPRENTIMTLGESGYLLILEQKWVRVSETTEGGHYRRDTEEEWRPIPVVEE